MHISLDRCELLAAARNAEKIAPPKSAVAALECVCLDAENDAVTVTSTNLELALAQRVPAEVQESGRMLIPAKWLSGALGVLRTGRVTLQHDAAGRVHILSSATEYTLAAPAIEEYPQIAIPFPEDTVFVSGVPAMVKRTVFAISDAVDRPALKCVNLVFTDDALQAFASDGHRIAMAKGCSKGAAATSLLIPAVSFQKLAQLVGAKDTLRVGVTGKTIVFSKENFLFSARLIEDQYPNAEYVLSHLQSRFTILTDAEQMRKALAAVASVSGTQNRFSLTFQADVLQLRLESELGISAIPLSVTALSGQPEGVFWYTLDTLRECLQALDGTLTLGVAQQGVLLLTTDELVCMQTAVRKPKPIEVPNKKQRKNAA